MSWLEDAPVPSARPTAKPSRRPAPKKTIDVKLEWLEPGSLPPASLPRKRRVHPPPLPREEPKTIPPTKHVRKGPPPLPREEPTAKTRRSLRPSKAPRR
jgi:hypothetical protein